MKRITSIRIAVVVFFVAITPDWAFGGAGIFCGYSASYSDLSNSTYGKSQWTGGLCVGLNFSIGLSELIQFWPAVMYVHRGGTYNSLPEHLDGSQAEVEYVSVQANYIELPALFRFGMGGSVDSGLNLVVGPSVGIIVSSKITQDGSTTNDWAEGADWGANLGLGYSTTLGRRGAGIDVIYRYPLSSVGLKHSGEGEVEFGGVQFLARVMF